MNEKPLRVLHVIHALGMGGAETWLMEVLRLWAKNKEVQMDFLATSGMRGVFDDEAMALGAHIHYIQYGKRHLASFVKRFRNLLSSHRYDALHDHQDYTSGWHFLMAGRHLPPVRITHVHNPSYQILNNYGTTYSRRITAAIGKHLVGKFATHITGTSRQVLTEYGFENTRYQSRPRLALHCGFDPSRFAGSRKAAKASICTSLGWTQDVRILLFAGRTDRSPDLGHPQNHKNSGFAVNLAIQLAGRDPSIRMIMCGAPSEATPVLETRIAKAGMVGRIIMLGMRHDIERFMLASDILLFPSRSEGLGMVAVEAQAAGLPVLASTAVPKECVVVNDLVQFLEVGDDPSPWLAAVHTLLNSDKVDHHLCNSLVTQSDFSIHNSAKKLQAIYKGTRSIGS